MQVRFSTGPRKHEDDCGHSDSTYKGSIFTEGHWYDVCVFGGPGQKGGEREAGVCMRRSSEPSDYISTFMQHVMYSSLHDDEPFSIYTLTRELIVTGKVKEQGLLEDTHYVATDANGLVFTFLDYPNDQEVADGLRQDMTLPITVEAVLLREVKRVVMVTLKEGES